SPRFPTKAGTALPLGWTSSVSVTSASPRSGVQRRAVLSWLTVTRRSCRPLSWQVATAWMYSPWPVKRGCLSHCVFVVSSRNQLRGFPGPPAGEAVTVVAREGRPHPLMGEGAFEMVFGLAHPDL